MVNFAIFSSARVPQEIRLKLMKYENLQEAADLLIDIYCDHSKTHREMTNLNLNSLWSLIMFLLKILQLFKVLKDSIPIFYP